MNKKKILAIQGSYKNNGITSAMLKYAVDESQKAGYDVEYIRLHDHRIEYCKGVENVLRLVNASLRMMT